MNNPSSKLAPLPQNIEAEQSILGGILTDDRVIEQVLETLTPEDFYRSAHKEIFKAMVELRNLGNPIDVVSLHEHFKSKGGVLEEVGGSSYFTYLPEVLPSVLNVPYYSKLVKEKSIERQLSEFHKSSDYKLSSGEITSDRAIELMRRKVESFESSSKSGLSPISAQDLKDELPPESLWGGLIYPEAITQVNAEPGMGKTTFVYNLIVHGVLNRPFLEIGFPKHLKVLNLDFETPEWLKGLKLRNIIPDDIDGLPKDLDFLSDFDIEKDFHDLIRLCLRKKYDVVVFDTQVRGLGLRDENDNSLADFKMGLLRRLCKKTGCAIILIHHTTKSDRKGVYSGRGASAIAGAVDIVVNMESYKEDEDVLKITAPKNRITGSRPPMFVRKAGEDRFEIYVPPELGSSGFEIYKAQDFILSLSIDSVWRTQEIYEACQAEGFGESTSKRALGQLVQTGKIKRVRKGIYKIISTMGQRVTQNTPRGGKSDPTDPYIKNSNDFSEIDELLSENPISDADPTGHGDPSVIRLP